MTDIELEAIRLTLYSISYEAKQLEQAQMIGDLQRSVFQRIEDEANRAMLDIDKHLEKKHQALLMEVGK